MWKRVSALLPSAARTAMGRMALRSGFGSLPPRARDAARGFNSSPRQQTASRIEFLQLPTVFNEAKALRTLHGKPLAVLTASVGEMRGWTAAQDKLAQLSTNTVHRTVIGATHAALLEDPNFARFDRSRDHWSRPSRPRKMMWLGQQPHGGSYEAGWRSDAAVLTPTRPDVLGYPTNRLYPYWVC